MCFSTWVSIAPPYEFTENANTYFRVMVPVIIITAGTVINALLTKKTPLIVGWLGVRDPGVHPALDLARVAVLRPRA